MKIIGLEVKPLCVKYAVHEIDVAKHVFVKDGALYVPSSLAGNRADHDMALLENLHPVFDGILEEQHGDIPVFCESYSHKPYDHNDSYKWIHAVLTDYFADHTEIQGIPIRDITQFRRKAYKKLENLSDYKWTRIVANFIAYLGTEDVYNDLYNF